MNKTKKGNIFFNKFQNKMIFIAFFSVLLTVSFIVFISYSNLNHLYTRTSEQTKKGLDKTIDEYMNNYINMTSDYIESKIERFFDEQAVLAGQFQEVIDREDEYKNIISQMNEMPSYKDNLRYSGRWYQNQPTQPTVLLVGRYLLEKDLTIKLEAQKYIKDSIILNLLMPQVYKNGANKLWVYLQGPRNNEFMRIYPWNDAGGNLDKIYPAFTDIPLWDSFNPGLIDDWEKKMKSSEENKIKPRNLAIMKQPSQDGGTGKIIVTISHPVWNRDRTKFLGSIAFDVELTEIINYTSKLKLAKNGFAFISQSSGNVFALNPEGAKILGLKSAEESTIKAKSGGEFNPMERFFKNSTFSDVKKIKMPKNIEILKNIIKINNKDYLIVQKKLEPVNTWKKGIGFYGDSWSLGFVVPKDELYTVFDNIRSEITTSRDEMIKMQLISSLLALVISGILIYIFSKTMTKDLKKLENATYEIMNKNYDVSVDISSKDEVGVLAIAISDMTKEIKSTIDKITEKNDELLLKNNQLDILTRKYEDILSIVSKLIVHTNIEEDSFFEDLLKAVMNIVPEADFGSISKIENEKWIFKAAKGYNKEKLNSLGLMKRYMLKFDEITIIDNLAYQNKNNMPEQLYSEFLKLSQPSKYHLFAPLKIQNDYLGNISLDIAIGNNEEFSEESVKAMEALSNIASAFISFEKYMEIRENFQRDIIMSIIKILEIYDKYTKGHSTQVAELCVKVLRQLGGSEEDLHMIYWAGLVHDIGKILVPDTILNKPERLLPEEYEQIKRHPFHGYEILKNSDQLKEISIIVLHHHERFDGNGYPYGLKGEEIPLFSRIITVVDAFDAMISDRAYRKGMSFDEAIEEIRVNMGKQFDPGVAQTFIALVQKSYYRK